MNERIKELAEQAGYHLTDLTEPHDRKLVVSPLRDEWVTLEKFYDLVRQDYAKLFITDAERDENIRSEERQLSSTHYLAIMRDAIETARLDEREKCAKVAEETYIRQIVYYPKGYWVDPNRLGEYSKEIAKRCAEAIRGRT